MGSDLNGEISQNTIIEIPNVTLSLDTITFIPIASTSGIKNFIVENNEVPSNLEIGSFIVVDMNMKMEGSLNCGVFWE